MPNPTARAKRYRDLAAECEQLAEVMETEKAKRAYQQIAAYYIRLADVEEKITVIV